MQFQIVHELEVPAETLWAYLFDPELERLAHAAMHLRDVAIVTHHDGGRTVRRIRGVPEVDAPAFVVRAIGAKSVSFEQEDVVPSDGTMGYAWTVVTETPAATVRMAGKLRVESLGPQRCRRVIDGDVKVPIFGVGPLIERFVAAQTRKNYEAVAVLQEGWIRARLAAA